MSDPMGSVGGSARKAPSDVDIAFEGGPPFAARIAQLSALKEANSEALAELKLGRSARAAYDEAARLHDLAVSDRNDAAGVLATAKADAEKLLADARDEAASYRVEAAKAADEMRAEAARRTAGIVAEMGRQKQLADDDRAAAAKLKGDAQAVLREAEAKAAEAGKAMDEQERQTAAAMAMQEDLKGKHAKLQGVLRDVMDPAPG